MDYSIVFKLKQIDLEEVGITERFTSWGEKDFSYSPRRFKGYGDIQLIEVEEPMEIEGSIELKVIGLVRKLEWQANTNPKLLADNKLMKLLEKICCLEYFSIYICEDDENIEEVFELDYSKCHDIYRIVTEALSWDKPQNIKIQNYQ